MNSECAIYQGYVPIVLMSIDIICMCILLIRKLTYEIKASLKVKFKLIINIGKLLKILDCQGPEYGHCSMDIEIST